MYQPSARIIRSANMRKRVAGAGPSVCDVGCCFVEVALVHLS